MYSIGRFSKICNIAVKTLRYYDDIDLLKPSYIDPATNYRYYDYDKIETIKLILLLKSLHIPLADIKQMIKSPEQVQWDCIIEQEILKLEREKEQIAKEIEKMKQLKRKVEVGIPLIQGPIISGCYFENREATLVYTIRRKIQIRCIDHLVQSLFDQVYAFNLDVNGKLMAIFHERGLKDHQMDVELLVPVKDSNDLENCRTLSSGKYACTTVKGPYTDLAAGYEALKNWVAENHLIKNGPMMEIYEKGLVPANLNAKELRPNLNRHPADLLTKICVPVK